MPYVTADRKEQLEAGLPIENPGSLNYLITKLLLRYWTNGPRSYQSINDIVGAVEAAKLEFYRRVVTIYEEKKRNENGDVYPDRIVS